MISVLLNKSAESDAVSLILMECANLLGTLCCGRNMNADEKRRGKRHDKEGDLVRYSPS